MPRDFIQVFRGEIINTEVESIVREEKYFMKGSLMCKSNSFERAAVEVTMTQHSFFPWWENDLLFQDLRNDFELILTTLSSHWENYRHHFNNEGSTFQGWTTVLYRHLVAKDRGLTLRSFPSQLSVLLCGIYLYCCHHFPASFLSGFSSTLSCPPHFHVLIYITDNILLVKMDEIILQWVHFIFMSRTATGNICTQTAWWTHLHWAYVTDRLIQHNVRTW